MVKEYNNGKVNGWYFFLNLNKSPSKKKNYEYEKNSTLATFPLKDNYDIIGLQAEVNFSKEF